MASRPRGDKQDQGSSARHLRGKGETRRDPFAEAEARQRAMAEAHGASPDETTMFTLAAAESREVGDTLPTLDQTLSSLSQEAPFDGRAAHFPLTVDIPAPDADETADVERPADRRFATAGSRGTEGSTGEGSATGGQPGTGEGEPSEESDGSVASVGRSAAMMSVLVIVSRITGFFRTWGQAFALGTTLLSSCYTVANNLPNQLYELVIGGMLVTAFLPVYLNVKKKAGREGANRYVSNLLSIVFVLMGVATVLCIVFASQLVWIQSAGTDQSTMVDAVFLFRFFAVEVLLYCLSSIASGVLNAERDYLWSTAAPIFNNFITIASFVLYAVLRNSNPLLAMLLLAFGNPLGVLVQVLMQVPSLRRHGVHLSLHIDLHDPALKDTLAIGVPSLVVTVASFVTVSVMNTYALVAVPEQGSSITYYARLWYTLPYSVLSVPITTAMFTELSSLFAKGDHEGFVRGITSGASQILFTLIPFMLYLIVFSYPLMMVMTIGAFSADSATITASYLSVLAIALPGYGLSTYFQKVFSSMRHMMLFAVANVVAAVVQVAFTVTMTDVIGIGAVALGSALYMIVVDGVSILLLRHHFHDLRFGSLIKASLRALALGLAGSVVGWLIMQGLVIGFGDLTSPLRAIVYLVAAGVPSVAVTFGLAIKLHIPEAAFFERALSRVLRKGRGAKA